MLVDKRLPISHSMQGNKKFKKLNKKKRESYKGLPIKSIRLPKGFREYLEIESGIAFNKNDIDSMSIIVNILFIANYSDRSHIPLHSKFLECIKKNYQPLMRFLVSLKVIDVDKSYKVDERSKGYRLNYQWLYKEDEIIELNKEKWIYYDTKNKDLKKWFNMILDNIQFNPIARISIANQIDNKVFNLPSRELIINKAIDLVKNDSKNKKGKIYRFFNEISLEDQESGLYTDINHGIKQFDSLLDNGWTIPSVSETYGRVTDKFNLMSKWIREEFKIDGEEMVELDFTALHPNLWYMFINDLPVNEQEFFLENVAGDSHTKIAELTGLSRVEVKVLFLSFFNDRIENITRETGKYKKIYNFYKTNLPTLLDIVFDTKKNGHSETCKFLFNNEVILLENIMVYCYQNNIAVGQCYDAVYVPASKALEVKEYTNNLYKDLIKTKIG